MVTDARVAWALGVVGISAYLLVGILYFGSALVMPYPWVFAMWALWIGGFIVLFRVFRDSRPWTPVVAVGAVVLWVIIVQLGSWLFGWTA
jgi:hypothetical protein